MYEFVETKLFTKHVTELLTDEDYAGLQALLCREPEIGDLIPGAGGLRRVRWGGSGRGKRGGVRVVYYVKTARQTIWMLTIYAKNQRDNIPVNVQREIAKEIKDA